MKINLNRQDPINYHVSNTFHLIQRRLTLFSNSFFFINLSIVPFFDSTKSSIFFLKF